MKTQEEAQKEDDEDTVERERRLQVDTRSKLPEENNRGRRESTKQSHSASFTSDARRRYKATDPSHARAKKTRESCLDFSGQKHDREGSEWWIQESARPDKIHDDPRSLGSQGRTTREAGQSDPADRGRSTGEEAFLRIARDGTSLERQKDGRRKTCLLTYGLVETDKEERRHYSILTRGFIFQLGTINS